MSPTRSDGAGGGPDADPMALLEAQQRKGQLRAILRERRRRVGARERGRWSASMRDHLLAHSTWREAEHIAGFVGTHLEPETRPLIEAAARSGKTYWLPRVDLHAPRRMTWVQVSRVDQMVPGAFGLLEPRADLPSVPTLDQAEVELALVPGLAFSASGARLGQGGGYYDTALGAVPAQARPTLIGICFSAFLDPDPPIPLEPHDVPIDWVVTECGAIACAAGGTPSHSGARSRG